jgi:hypothetical protein
MRVSKLVARTLREDPKDAQLRSHNLLLRGGYILQVAAGIYTMMPLGKRVVSKIERIIREEMNRIEGRRSHARGDAARDEGGIRTLYAVGPECCASRTATETTCFWA